jgi:hypothetical protein
VLQVIRADLISDHDLLPPISVLVGVLQDQPCYQAGRCRLCLRPQSKPGRHLAERLPRVSCEQVDLLRRTTSCLCRLARLSRFAREAWCA